jgi:hypothetical protein
MSRNGFSRDEGAAASHLSGFPALRVEGACVGAKQRNNQVRSGGK